MCLGLVCRREACVQPTTYTLFENNSTARAPVSQLRFSWSQHKIHILHWAIHMGRLETGLFITTPPGQMALVYTWAAFMVVFKSHNHSLQKAKSCLITLQVHTSDLDCEIITLNKDFSSELKDRHKPHKLGSAITTQVAHKSNSSPPCYIWGEGRDRTSGRNRLRPLQLSKDFQ